MNKEVTQISLNQDRDYNFGEGIVRVEYKDREVWAIDTSRQKPPKWVGSMHGLDEKATTQREERILVLGYDHGKTRRKGPWTYNKRKLEPIGKDSHSDFSVRFESVPELGGYDMDFASTDDVTAERSERLSTAAVA